MEKQSVLVVTLTVEELKQLLLESIALIGTPKPDEVLMTRKEVASLFKVSLVTINQWMRSGRLPFCRINSRVYFKRNQILESLQDTTVTKNFSKMQAKKR
jgi:excisionase family DNA binding protein